jgi:hypothetical protein
MIIPHCTTIKNGGYTASLPYRAPFPLDFEGIYVIENARGIISGEYVIGNIGNNGNGNLRRRFGYTLLAEKKWNVFVKPNEQ